MRWEGFDFVFYLIRNSPETYVHYLAALRKEALNAGQETVGASSSSLIAFHVGATPSSDLDGRRGVCCGICFMLYRRIRFVIDVFGDVCFRSRQRYLPSFVLCFIFLPDADVCFLRIASIHSKSALVYFRCDWDCVQLF